jgi:glycosyltransferase involved in cell wall biosynthesis
MRNSTEGRLGEPEVELILPCLDEAEGLRWLLPRVPRGIGVVVADNGSVDGSRSVAQQWGAGVVEVSQRGYGAACHAGLLAAQAEIVVVMDADGSCDPAQLDRVVAPVRDDCYDLVIGARRPVSARAQSWPLRAANRVLAGRLNRRTGLRLHDLGPVRAARRRGLLDLAMTDRRSGYPADTVVRAADAGWRIGETWMDYRVRCGRSKVTGTPWGAWRAVQDMSAALVRDTR